MYRSFEFRAGAGWMKREREREMFGCESLMGVEGNRCSEGNASRDWSYGQNCYVREMFRLQFSGISAFCDFWKLNILFF